MAERTELLTQRLDEVHSLIAAGELDRVEITGDGFSIKPYRGTPVPAAARTFVDLVNGALPRIKITDLLVEVDGWTGFSEQFTHLRSGLPCEDKKDLLTVILADGVNLGLTRMAEAAPGSSFKRLSRVADWHVREDCYSRALAEIVNQHHQVQLAGCWGDGTTSSSDGQHFPLGSVGQELGHRNPKYGSRPVVIFYTHVSDQYSPYHTKCITTNARDATYVLDGLLYHNTDLVIEEHYTDTAGFTDQVFGLCHLLGFSFAPRIRDIGERRLYPLGERKRWPKLEPTFGEAIRLREIESQWDEILRAASSIRLGTVTASLLVRKLAAYPRQNRLALAMRELGRIERTLFLLNWMQDPTLQTRVQAGLNKGEARNALARAVFFNRLGELRDRSFEGQSTRASGLNLLVAAIILWNTRYLELAVEQVRSKIDVPDEYLQYLSPLGWEHINLTGDYIWNLP
jgi:TnpA family transposase